MHGSGSEGQTGKWSAQPVPFTLPRNMYPALLPPMRTPRLPAVDWTDAPCRFKWTRPFRGKRKSGLCACAITFQTQSTAVCPKQRSHDTGEEFNIVHFPRNYITYGTAMPVQSWTVPEVSRKMRLPHFMTIGTWKW